MHSPTKHHYGATKRILRYVAATADLGLWYTSTNQCKLAGYVDSDWAGCMEDRRSTSGYVFDLGSGAVSWSSKKQATIALSSSEAEYMAATTAACQAIWLKRVLGELEQEQKEVTKIYCDNKAAIALSKNPVHHGRTKHIDIRVHFIRELVAEGKIELVYCNTEEQIADILTKPLTRSKFEYLRSKLGVCDFGSRGSVGK